MLHWILPWNGRTRLERAMGWLATLFLATAIGSIAIDELEVVSFTLILIYIPIVLFWAARALADVRRHNRNFTMICQAARGEINHNDLPAELQEELNIIHARARLREKS